MDTMTNDSFYGPPPPPVQPAIGGTTKNTKRARNSGWGKRIFVIGVFMFLGGIILTAVSHSSTKTPTTPALSTAPAPAAPAAPAPAPAPAAPAPAPAPAAPAPAPAPAAPAPAPAPAAPTLTTSQSEAISQAKEYLDTQAFSRSGLIKQLDSPYGGQFSEADATYAVDSLNVDWSAQAAKAAKEYLGTMAFSHAGLVEQLASPYGSGFTQAQAEYGVSAAGL
jgi:hypothetical protein